MGLRGAGIFIHKWRRRRPYGPGDYETISNWPKEVADAAVFCPSFETRASRAPQDEVCALTSDEFSASSPTQKPAPGLLRPRRLTRRRSGCVGGRHHRPYRAQWGGQDDALQRRFGAGASGRRLDPVRRRGGGWGGGGGARGG